MNDADLEQLFDSLRLRVEKNKGAPIERVLRSPLRLPWSKLMEKICQIAHKTMTLKASTFWGDEMNVVFPELVSCFLRL